MPLKTPHTTSKVCFMNQRSIFYTASFFGILTAGFLSFFSVNTNYMLSDPYGTLATSEVLISHGTIKLDASGIDLSGYDYRVHQKNGHYYYYFPIGTPVFITPIIATLKLANVDIAHNEIEIQKAISVLTSMITVWLMTYLASFFIKKPLAPLFATVFWLGSTLSSTNGVALWSHNFAVIFGLVGVIYSVRMTLAPRRGDWAIIGLSIFLAYLARPTMSLFGVFLVCFLLIQQRKCAIKVIALLVALLGLFVAFSEHEFLQPLPDYYLPGRVAQGAEERSLEGVLFSPSRGLFIFMPFLIVSFIAAFRSSGDNSWPFGKSWLLIGLLWPLAHLLLVASFQPWTGGWCFGPRLSTDAMPGLFLLTLHALPQHLENLSNRLIAFVLAITLAFSMAVHVRQGMFNKWTWAWNRDVSETWDWSYPQFLASEEGFIRYLQKKHPDSPTLRYLKNHRL